MWISLEGVGPRSECINQHNGELIRGESEVPC